MQVAINLHIMSSYRCSALAPYMLATHFDTNETLL
jgi:hypothetical protein